LPPGAPTGFGGAVGLFSLRAELDRDAADVGAPLQLTAVLEGDGNLATLAPPVVDAPASFERYEPIEDRTLDRSRAPASGQKTFSWSMVPRSGGLFELGVEFAYFDPRAEQYRSLSVTSLDVEVSGEVDPVSAATDGPAAPLSDAEWRRDPTGRPSGFWLLAGGALPVGALAALAVGTHLKRPRRRTASSLLAAASAALEDPNDFYVALEAALRDAMSSGRLSSNEAAAAQALIDRANRALYARGGAPSRAERESDLRRAETLIPR
jgi:hypothetical protein